ncbi:MAG: hypothetical protein QG599_1181 [Pseudomonadota bacterium]|nr:hypothetical protein [Pseudomonadota bacterium]
MRCPECNHNQKSREGSRCQKCRYQFVFYSKSEPIRDFTLRQIIQRLSDNGEYAFTATQLALEICRVWRKKTFGAIGCSVIALILSGIVGVIAFTQWGWIGLALALLTIQPLAFWLGRRGKSALSVDKACKVIKQYHQIHPIRELADGAAFRQSPPTTDFQDPHYAPERILVVERDELVDLLIRNRFHLTAKAVVVSRSGYPERVFAACQEFLRHHPTTPVMVVHDASLMSFALTAQLRADPQWRFASSRLFDLGISRDALNSGSSIPWLPVNALRGAGIIGGHSEKRLRAGYRVPLDYVGPKSLINLLSAAVVDGVLLLAPEILNGSSVGVEVDYG